MSLLKRYKRAQEWIYSKSGYKGDFKNGIALCQAASKIDPNIWKQTKPKKLKIGSNAKTGVASNRERVAAFIKFCENKGVAEHDRFVTLDLIEDKDITKVCICIEALKRRIEKGKDVNQRPKKKIDKSKWQNPNSVIPKLAQGDNQIDRGTGVDSYGIVQHANVSNSNWNKKQYNKTNNYKSTNTVVPKSSQGSKAVNNGSNYDSYGIVKHANVSNSNWNKKQYNKTNNYKTSNNFIPKSSQGSKAVNNSSNYDSYGIVKHPNVSNSNWNKKQYQQTNNYVKKDPKKIKKNTKPKKSKHGNNIKPSTIKKSKSKGNFLSSIFGKKKPKKKADDSWVKK